MLTELTTNDWKNYINKSSTLGEYVSHRTLNNTNQTINNDTFLKHITEVTVLNEGTPFYIYFNNSGPVYISEHKCNNTLSFDEYDFVCKYPSLVSDVYHFIKTMGNKFGKNYLKQRLEHCNNEIINKEEQLLKTEFSLELLNTSYEDSLKKEKITNEPFNAKKQYSLFSNFNTNHTTNDIIMLEQKLKEEEEKYYLLSEYLDYQNQLMVSISLLERLSKPAFTIVKN